MRFSDNINRLGFTFLELLLVIAIIGLLAAISAPKVGGVLAMSQTVQTARNLGGAIRLTQQAALIQGDTQEITWQTFATGHKGFRYKPFNAPTEEVRVEQGVIFNPQPWPIKISPAGDIFLASPAVGTVEVSSQAASWTLIVEGKTVRTKGI